MQRIIKILLGVLTACLSQVINAQELESKQTSDLILWKGSVDLFGEYSTYRPSFQTIPSSYGYLNSNQQVIIEGIPFRGYLFLSSYQAASLNRYSFSFDSDALHQNVRERVENKISSLQQVPAIGAMQQRFDKILEPGQYEKLNEINKQLANGEIAPNASEEYSSILKLQQQLLRYDPDVYSQYEQYLQLRSIDEKQDYRKNIKDLQAQGLVSSSEAIWYNFNAFQVGTTSPFFSNLDLAGVPVRGYFAAYSTPYLYLATANGTTLPFNIQDSLMSFSRNLEAYKLGYGGVRNSHLHFSYVHGEDIDLLKFNPAIANTIVGIDGRLKLFKGKLDLQAKTFLSAYTSDTKAQAESNTITNTEISGINGLGTWLSKDVKLNSSTITGNAHHIVVIFKNKDLKIDGEYRRVDPGYRSVGVAYLRSDVERFQLSIDKMVLDKRLRLYGKIRLDEDNLNAGKRFTGKNVNGIVRVHSYFKKLPNITLTYMPNSYISRSFLTTDIVSHNSHMLSLASSKRYRFANLIQVTSGSLTYNTYQLKSGSFSSMSTSLNQMVVINKKISTSLQLIYRQTNTSYYWSLMPSLKYKITNRGMAHFSFRYGQDYFQNTRYGMNIGARLKINDKLLLGLSVIQHFYTLTKSISDLRVRSSLRIIW